MSVIADSFNNLSDASSNIIALIGSKLASQPADKKHPFGHGRIEYISALIVAIVIIEVGFESLKSSAAKILHPESTELTAISLVILCMTVLVKLWMAVFYRKIGTRIGSQLLPSRPYRRNRRPHRVCICHDLGLLHREKDDRAADR